MVRVKVVDNWKERKEEGGLVRMEPIMRVRTKLFALEFPSVVFVFVSVVIESDSTRT